MFDVTNSQTHFQHLNFNSVSGTLIKSHADSIITRFHMNSPMAEKVFHEKNPKCNDKDIIVLQVMLCGDKEFLVEFMYKTKESQK